MTKKPAPRNPALKNAAKQPQPAHIDEGTLADELDEVDTLERTLAQVDAPAPRRPASPRREEGDRERGTLNHATNHEREIEIDGMKFRRSRTGLDHSSKMTLDIAKDLLNPNLEYRWVNDDGARVQRCREFGYEIVDASSLGGKIETTRRVGTQKNGSAQNSILMATPKKWYDERQAAAEKDRKEREHGLVTGKKDGDGDMGAEYYVNKAAKISS